MRSIDVVVDIGQSVAPERTLQTAATVHLPDGDGPWPVVVFAFPGAGYGRKYYDLRFDDGYSQAEYHTALGTVFVACDHLGVGDSSIPTDPFSIEYEDLASANAATVAGVLKQMRAGLAIGVGPLVPQTIIGLGQSMGGCLLTVQQGSQRTFDAVGMLGWTNVHCQFPDPSGSGTAAEDPTPRGADLRTMKPPMFMSDEVMRYAYHFEDVPHAIVDADMKAVFDPVLAGGPDAPWRSPTVPLCAWTMVSPRTAAPEAARIDVPVLVAVGQRDVMVDPLLEATAYPRSPDVTVASFPRMAHMHNFASSRQRLWKRVELWCQTVHRLHVTDDDR
jgi:alpha-beta hydrolase superfamily lysophospholipase